MNKKQRRDATDTKDTSPYVWQSPKIDYSLGIRTRPDLTEHQKQVIDLILDKNSKITFISGPAGVSKTFLSLYCGLKLLNEKKISKILYSRPMLESADPGSHLGLLPGLACDKMSPYAVAMNCLLEEILPLGDIKKLNSDDRLEVIPVNYVRGLTFSNQFCIFDECSSFTLRELQTLLSRIGSYSRVVCLSDPSQSDLPFNKQGGFDKIIKLFSDEDSKAMGINSVYFTDDEIVRSPICKFMVKKFKELESAAPIISQAEWKPKS